MNAIGQPAPIPAGSTQLSLTPKRVCAPRATTKPGTPMKKTVKKSAK